MFIGLTSVAVHCVASSGTASTGRYLNQWLCALTAILPRSLSDPWHLEHRKGTSFWNKAMVQAAGAVSLVESTLPDGGDALVFRP